MPPGYCYRMYHLVIGRIYQLMINNKVTIVLTITPKLKFIAQKTNFSMVSRYIGTSNGSIFSMIILHQFRSY